MDANINPSSQMLEDILEQSKKVIAKNNRMNKAKEPNRGLIITEIFRYFRAVTRYLEGQFPVLICEQFHDTVYDKLMKKPYSVQVKEIDLLFEALKEEETKPKVIDDKTKLCKPFDPFNEEVDLLDISPIQEMPMSKEQSKLTDGSSPEAEEEDGDKQLNYDIKPQKAKTLILHPKSLQSTTQPEQNEVVLLPKKVSSKTEEAKVNNIQQQNVQRSQTFSSNGNVQKYRNNNDNNVKELFRKEIDKNDGSKNSQNSHDHINMEKTQDTAIPDALIPRRQVTIGVPSKPHQRRSSSNGSSKSSNSRLSLKSQTSLKMSRMTFRYERSLIQDEQTWKKQKSLQFGSILLRITNVKVLWDHELCDQDLWIDKQTGKIIPPPAGFDEKSQTADHECTIEIIDGKGGIVSPGFIDLQFNGGFGVDFSKTKQILKHPSSIQECCQRLLQTGVTSVCPTLISCSPYDYEKLIRLFPKTSGKKTKAASMLGLHLEGPYFGLEKIGAHPLNNIKTPKNHPISKVYGDDLKNVKIVTLAPEVDGSLDLINELKTKHPSIVVSIGHSSANLKEAQMSVRAGATKITHLFNAMRSFHHRDPGIVGLLGCAELNENLYYGIICDGFHCHPSCVQMAYQSHPTGACLVTDAMSALGLPKGRHTLGDSVVEVVDADLDGLKGIKAVLADSDTLAGAIVTMDECVRNFHRFAKCSITEALDAATINPARCLGISDHKGKLAYGFDGDIVILEQESLKVLATFIEGECLVNLNLPQKRITVKKRPETQVFE